MIAAALPAVTPPALAELAAPAAAGGPAFAAMFDLAAAPVATAPEKPVAAYTMPTPPMTVAADSDPLAADGSAVAEEPAEIELQAMPVPLAAALPPTAVPQIVQPGERRAPASGIAAANARAAPPTLPAAELESEPNGENISPAAVPGAVPATAAETGTAPIEASAAALPVAKALRTAGVVPLAARQIAVRTRVATDARPPGVAVDGVPALAAAVRKAVPSGTPAPTGTFSPVSTRRDDTAVPIGVPEAPLATLVPVVSRTAVLEPEASTTMPAPRVLPPAEPVVDTPAASAAALLLAAPPVMPAPRLPTLPIAAGRQAATVEARVEPLPADPLGDALLPLSAASAASVPLPAGRPPETAPARSEPPIAEPAASNFEIATDRLGSVAVAIDGKPDALAIRFSVERAAAAALLADHAARLDAALSAGGSRLDALSVDIRDAPHRRAPPPPFATPAAQPLLRPAPRTLRDRYA